MVECIAMTDLRDEELTQKIRLLDVFGIGPLMIYAGAKAKSELSTPVRAGLIVAGVATIGYNGMNYLANEEDAARRRLNEEDRLNERLTSLVGDVES